MKTETMMPRSEYPRPDFDRSERWLSLNGDWFFFRRDADQRKAETIVVPFAWETPKSGVGAHWLDRASYSREFVIPEDWAGSQVILHFGAVHHTATVSVDGHHVGSHTGGYTPFEFDITDFVSPGTSHHLQVDVEAPIDKRAFPHGKQRSVPPDDYDGCSFTPASGIWQSLWLEPRPSTYLSCLTLGSTPELDGVTVRGDVSGPDASAATVTVTVVGVPDATLTVDAASFSKGLTIDMDSPTLWEPGNPFLYQVTCDVQVGESIDHVKSYVGIRRFEARGDAFFLNGRRVMLRGILDQGYWPSSGMTAPDDSAFVRDIALAQELGFNLVRKHLKLEDPRFLFHADRMGMLVWEEPPSTGRFSEDAVKAFDEQVTAMVERDASHPCTIIWGLYNEEWGLNWDLPGDPAKLQAVRNTVALLRSLDSTRPLVDNSGWSHVDTDLFDWHVYDEHPVGWAVKVQNLMSSTSPTFPVAIAVDKIVEKQLLAEGDVPTDRPLFNSEFGGGYTPIERGWNLHWQTQELRRYDKLSGYIWTELTDIEQETAGIADAARIIKDHGGRPPRLANALTVPVFDVKPVRPGYDLDAVNGTASLTLAVSHHGPTELQIDVLTAWSPIFADEPATPATKTGSIDVMPFELSDSIHVACPLPDDPKLRRLHILLADTQSGEQVGHGMIDVAN